MAKKSAATAAVEAGFSFESLSVRDTHIVPKSQEPTPFDDAILASYETRNDDEPVSKTITVPDAHVKAAVLLIRKGAGNLNVGVSVVTQKNSDGTTDVTFRGKDKRRRSGVNAQDVDNGEYDDSADTLEYADEK